jgi:hypothetical protein
VDSNPQSTRSIWILMFDSQMNTEWASSSLLCVRFTPLSCCKSNRLGRFGGLFSAVNFTFVVRMQLDPRDPLYVLTVKVIDNTLNAVHDIAIILVHVLFFLYCPDPTLASHSLTSLRFGLSWEDSGSTPSPIRRCRDDALRNTACKSRRN